MSANDNWAHRGDRMKCKTCMFYVEKGDGRIGRCRESSPTLKGFPAVYPDDWCGAHKLDESKIEENHEVKLPWNPFDCRGYAP